MPGVDNCNARRSSDEESSFDLGLGRRPRNRRTGEREHGAEWWWPFYEGTGTTAHDLSGNHNDGTLSGGAQWTSGYSGPGLSFNGDGAKVQVPDKPAFEPCMAVTVMAYVKASGSPGDLKYIVAKGGFGCATGAYGLYTGSNGGLIFYVDHPDGVNFTLSPDYGTGVWDGNWHFVRRHVRRKRGAPVRGRHGGR